MTLKRKSFFICGLLLLGLSATIPAQALAQRGSARRSETQRSEVRRSEALGPEARARRLLEEGLRLRREGHDQEALDRFEEANQLAPSTLTQAQIALAAAAVGSWLRAHATLGPLLALRDDAWIEEHRAALTGVMETIEEHLGRLDLRGGVEGAELRVDGEEVGRLPLPEPLWVLAGTVVVTVSAEGYHSLERTVRVEASGVAREQLRLVPLHAEAPPEGGEPGPGDPIAPAPSPTPDLTLPIALYAVGAAGLIAFGALGGLALGEHSALAERCGDPDPCEVSDIETGRQLSIGADVALSVGLVGVAAATVALAIELSSSGAESEEVAFRPWLTPESGGLFLGGSF